MSSGLLQSLLVVASALLGSCTSGHDSAGPVTTTDIPFTIEGRLYFERDDGSPITDIGIEIADDDSTRTRGLMQRATIPDSLGMLFIFGRQTTQSFWMANTPHALDIIFVNSDLQIVDIAKYTRPFSPLSLTSRAPSLYVVEVKAGFTDTWGISETDRVRWE